VQAAIRNDKGIRFLTRSLSLFCLCSLVDLNFFFLGGLANWQSIEATLQTMLEPQEFWGKSLYMRIPENGK